MPTVPRRGLHPHVVSDAIRNANVVYRAENHDKYRELFADNHQLSKLDNTNWQVIYGRRGSGKTFLLGVLAEELNRTADESRSLAVTITCQDCLVSPQVTSLVDDRQVALGYFEAFLQELSRALFERFEVLWRKESFWERFAGALAARRDRCETALLEFASLGGAARPLAAFTRERTREVRERVIGSNSEVGATARLGYDPPSGVKAAISATVGAKVQNSEESKSTTEREIASVVRLSDVRKHLVEILDQAEIHRLVILIDEWPVLDSSAATAIQPEFGELLKRAFMGEPRVSVKIATNRYQTRLSNRTESRGYRGLELEQEIFEATNLDHALLSDRDLFEFFKALLFKRLVERAPQLSVFQTRASESPDDQFILEIFKDLRAFEELVTSAAGIPRDFLTSFCELAKRRNFSVDPRWDLSLVREVVLQRSVSTRQQDIEYDSIADQLLNRAVRDVVTATQSKVLFVQRTDYEDLQLSFEELLEKRFLHQIQRNDLSPEVRVHYEGFQIDHGVWLDWQRSIARANHKPHQVPVSGITLENISGLVMSPAHIRRDRRVCPSCEAVVDLNSKPFRVAGLCSECFRPIESRPADPTTSLSNEIRA